MAAAAIVVANPVAPPVRDLQISTTQLFTSPEALIPFDKDLLKSISQPTPAPNFNVALAQILGALAAEADRIGTEVNSNTSAPLTPAAAGLAVPAYAPLSVDVPAGVVPNGTASSGSSAVVPVAVTASAPVIQQVVAEVTADTAYLGKKVVEAAYAAVTALVGTPDLIFKAVQAVLVGDLATAFATIAQAIKAFFDPGLILVGGIDDVVGQYGPPYTNPPAGPSAGATKYSPAAPAAVEVGATESVTDPEPPVAEPGSGKPRQASATTSARRAGTEGTSQLTPRSSASSPGTANSSHSGGSADADKAEQPKAKASGSEKAGSASSGRSPNAGRGASARD